VGEVVNLRLSYKSFKSWPGTGALRRGRIFSFAHGTTFVSSAHLRLRHRTLLLPLRLPSLLRLLRLLLLLPGACLIDRAFHRFLLFLSCFHQNMHQNMHQSSIRWSASSRRWEGPRRHTAPGTKCSTAWCVLRIFFVFSMDGVVQRACVGALLYARQQCHRRTLHLRMLGLLLCRLPVSTARG